ncbi:MAG: SGNH/GDSL hydrolase family protein [Opitutales bacterium]
MSTAQPYPAPPPPEDTSAYGVGIQRTLQKLARSNAENGERVRILFYGQSIIGQRWHTMVEADLRRRFPEALLEVENLALGGFSSQRLVRTTLYDVLPYYPDLLVFHVYGGDQEYEAIIRTIRAHTTAEILIQTDHTNYWPEDQGRRDHARWANHMNERFLPRMAREYGTALQPQREEWLAYLKAHGLEPADLLQDSVHLNEHGRWLMAELLKRFMVLSPEATPESASQVTTYIVGKDIHFNNGVLKMDFDGNRVEALVSAPAAETPPIRVTINDRAPSAYSEIHYHTRPSRTPLIDWPAIKQIGHEAPLRTETWTLAVTGLAEDSTSFEFSLEGSVTGPDGTGRANEDFVSDSGRVRIQARDWVFDYARSVGAKENKGSMPDAWTVTWDTTFAGMDTLPLNSGQPTWAVLVSGLPAPKAEPRSSGECPSPRHRLRLEADSRRAEGAVKAIRVHRPPMAEAPAD